MKKKTKKKEPSPSDVAPWASGKLKHIRNEIIPKPKTKNKE